MGSARTRVPKQGRSKHTRESLARAALELFEQKGYFSTTTRDIAEVAGTSVGSFYVYFEDKRDVLLELVDSARDHALSVVRKTLSQTTEGHSSPEQRVRALLSSLSAIKALHPYLWAQARLIAHFDGAIDERLTRYAAELSEEVGSALAEWAPRAREGDPNAAAAVVLQTAGILDVVNGGDNDAVNAEVNRSVTHYLYSNGAQ